MVTGQVRSGFDVATALLVGGLLSLGVRGGPLARAACAEDANGVLRCSGELPTTITWDGDIVIEGSSPATLTPGVLTQVHSNGGTITINASIDGYGDDGADGDGSNGALLNGQPGEAGASLELKTIPVGGSCAPQFRGSIFVNAPIDLHGGDGGDGATCDGFDCIGPKAGGDGGAGADGGSLTLVSAQGIFFAAETYVRTSAGAGGDGAMGNDAEGGDGGGGGIAGDVTLAAHPYGDVVVSTVDANGGAGGTGGPGSWAWKEFGPGVGEGGGVGGPGGAGGIIQISGAVCWHAWSPDSPVTLGAAAGWGGSGGAGAGVDSTGYTVEYYVVTGGAGANAGGAGSAGSMLLTLRNGGTLYIDARTAGGNGGGGGHGGGGAGNDDPANPAQQHPGVHGGDGAAGGAASSGGEILIEFTPQERYGDFDHYGDVDLADFQSFQTCLSGANQPPPCACIDIDGAVATDADGDADVDLSDFSKFQAHFSGPNQLVRLYVSGQLVTRGGDAGPGGEGGNVKSNDSAILGHVFLAVAGDGAPGNLGGNGGPLLTQIDHPLGRVIGDGAGLAVDAKAGSGGDGGNGGDSQGIPCQYVTLGVGSVGGAAGTDGTVSIAPYTAFLDASRGDPPVAPHGGAAGADGTCQN